MNKAALKVYKTLRKQGTQKGVVADMQTRDELYDYLNYHSYEKKLDELFPAIAPKPKKSVALSGVPAGNTALCTVGRTGNDLHYRGYDILDFADQAEFEEVAYLLVHEKLPTRDELEEYKNKLRRPARAAQGAESRPGAPAEERRIRWTCCAPAARCSARSSRRRTTTARPARADRRPADGLLRLDAALLVPLRHSAASASKRRPTTIRSAATT